MRRAYLQCLLKVFVVGLLAGSGGFLRAQPQDLAPEVLAYADLIWYNGKVLTADDDFTIAEAVAVRGGKFMALGDDQRILRMAGPRTRKIDLNGKTVTPGFIDTHFHMYSYAIRDHREELAPSPYYIENSDVLPGGDKAAFLRALRTIASSRLTTVETPVGEWIMIDLDSHGIAGVISQGLRKEDLDEIFPHHPVAVGPGGASWYAVNAKGLKLLREYISPRTEGIMKDPETGEPTGFLIGEAASALGYGILPWMDVEKLIPLHKAAQRRFNAVGLTAISTKVPPEHITALREIWRRGEMTMRWRIALQIIKAGDPEFLLKILGNISDVGDGMFNLSSMNGGATDGGSTAWTWEPRLRPDVRTRSLFGFGFRPAMYLNRTGRWKRLYFVAKYGWNVQNTHSRGDRGNDGFISAIEEGLKNPLIKAHNQRFGIDHQAGLTERTPEGNQMERMKRLNIIPSMNVTQYLGVSGPGARAPEGGEGVSRRGYAERAGMSRIESWAYEFGADRVARMLPVKTAIKAGLRPTAEADSADRPPLLTLERLVTRKDDKGKVWGADERLSRAEALWMHTNWGAYYLGDEDKLGTIEPGKLADLVVLDGDYMGVPEDQISELEVVMTVVDGKVVHEIPGKLD